MASNEDSADFNEARADIFEAISHPARIKILQTLNEKPMGFAELGRAVGIEGGGHLSFHLRKLTHLVKMTPEGTYALTGDGKEALWSINTLRKATNGSTNSGESVVRHKNWVRPVLGVLVVGLLIFGAVAVFQEQQVLSQQGEITSLRNNLTSDQSQISTQQQLISKQEKQIATLFASHLPACPTSSQSLVEYPPEQVFLLNQVVPLLQNISGMAVVSNFTAGAPFGGILYSQIVNTSFHVISENKSSGMTSYDVSLNYSVFNSEGIWANGSIHYQPYWSTYATFSVKPEGTVSESREAVSPGPPAATSLAYYTNSTAISDFSRGMFPFVRQEYCQSLGAEIESLSSVQFVPNGTTISTLGSTTMSVTNFQANLPINTTSIPDIYDYDYRAHLFNVTDLSVQVGLVPAAGMPLLVAIHVSYGCCNEQFAIRVTSVGLAGGA